MTPLTTFFIFVSVSSLLFLSSDAFCAAKETEETKNFKTIFDLLFNIGNGLESDYSAQKLAGYGRLECPLCDSSVYSYCSEKLLHDACCCLNPYEHKLPYQCKFADCGFLHANSCREHKLITACCCSPKYHHRDGLFRGN